MFQLSVPLIFFMQQPKQPKPVAPKTYNRRQTRNTTAADAAASDVGQEQATTKPTGGGRLKKSYDEGP
jgi:hypothetical protein